MRRRAAPLTILILTLTPTIAGALAPILSSGVITFGNTIIVAITAMRP